MKNTLIKLLPLLFANSLGITITNKTGISITIREEKCDNYYYCGDCYTYSHTIHPNQSKSINLLNDDLISYRFTFIRTSNPNIVFFSKNISNYEKNHQFSLIINEYGSIIMAQD